MSAPAIGIDLGTTFSCVAVYKNGKGEIIANEQGCYTTPSIVAFNEQERLVGEPARSQAGTNPRNTVFDAKRLIGRQFSDKITQEDIKHWPFEVIDENGKPKIKVEYKGDVRILDPEEISAMILERMKQIAENYLGKPVEKAVITVPAYFNDAQRQATKDAGKIAGLNVMRIINEPTAAAIAYGLQSSGSDAARNILVFDLGGGTFDVTVLNIDDGIFEVKSTSGDTHLGGEDFDNRMVTHVIEEVKKKHKKDVQDNQKALSRIRTACERAKRTLSSNQEVSIDIDSLIDGEDFHMTFSRKRFESLNADIFHKVLEPINIALRDAKLQPTQIDDVVLVGGSSRIPKIVELLRTYFNRVDINRDINPDEAVAYGAAVHAAKLAGDESEELQEMVLLDITPLSLGIETTGGMMSVIVPKNTTVPVSESKTFTTHKDNQTTVKVQVYEGERPLTKDNNLLGDFRLTGITASRVGQTEIIVQFSVDCNGILNVTAKEKSADKKENTLKTRCAGARLTPDEIKAMIKRAEEFRNDDERERQRVQSKVNLESLCLRFQSDFRSPSAKGKVSGTERERMFTAIAEALSWIDLNYKACKEEYDQKYKEVHDNCDPFRRKIFDKNAQCCEEEDDTSSSYGGID